MRKLAAFLACLLLASTLHAGASRLWADTTIDRLINVTASSYADLTAGWSVTAWVLPDAGINASEVILRSSTNQSTPGAQQSTGDKINYFNGAANSTSTINITTSAWNHVAITRSGTAIAFYINGVAAGTGTNGVNLPAADVIGIYNAGVEANRWSGNIADVRIYNRTLTAAEAATAAQGIAPPDPYCWWPLWDASTQVELGTQSLCANGTNTNTSESSAGPPISFAAGAIP